MCVVYHYEKTAHPVCFPRAVVTTDIQMARKLPRNFFVGLAAGSYVLYVTLIVIRTAIFYRQSVAEYAAKGDSYQNYSKQ